MATAFAHDVPDTSHSLARASAKLAQVAATGTGKIALAIGYPDDAALTAELREKGLAGPISADFLTRYRRDREFMLLAKKLDTIPDGEERFIRALKRVGIGPVDDPTDAKLLAAWDRWKVAVGRIEDGDGNVDDYEDDIRVRDEAEDVILAQAASTTAGAAVKLRFALGSGLVDHSQKMTVAARAIAEKKTIGQRS